MNCACISQWSSHCLCSSIHWPLESHAWYNTLLLQALFLFSSALRHLAPNGNCLLQRSAKREFPSSQCLCSPVWNSSTANPKNVSSVFPADHDSTLVQHTGNAGVSCWHGICTHVLPRGPVLSPVELQYGWTEFVLRHHFSRSQKIHNAKLGMWHVLMYVLLMGSWSLIKCWTHCGYLIKFLI